MKYIGIIGTRRRTSIEDYIIVRDKFNELFQKGDRIVSGGCPVGGDEFAERLARSNGASILIHHADWKTHGRAAGFIRNTYIAQDADIIIACVAFDRKGGTEDTIKKFLKTKSIENLYIV